MRRKKMSKKRSKRLFRNTADRIKSRNYKSTGSTMRGGTRL